MACVFFLFVFIILLLLNVFPKFHLDKNTLVLIFTCIGISLLPFMDKIKIGNFLEIERLKEKIEEVKLTQYLGEVIKTYNGDLFFYDSEGRHNIPDKETAVFLRTNKGDITVRTEELNRMKVSHQIDSVMKSKIVKWNEHIFVILNQKKYHVSSWSYLADWGKKNVDETISDENIKLIPTAR